MNKKIPLTQYDFERLPVDILIIGGAFAYENKQLFLILIKEFREEIIELLRENCPDLLSRLFG